MGWTERVRDIWSNVSSDLMLVESDYLALKLILVELRRRAAGQGAGGRGAAGGGKNRLNFFYSFRILLQKIVERTA